MLSNDDHKILFGETQVLSSTQRYFAQLQREVVEIYNHGNHSMNKKEEFLVLNKYCIPALKNGEISEPIKKE